MARIVDDAGVLTAAERERLAAVTPGSSAELIVHLVPSVAKRAFRQHAVAVRRQLSDHYERSVIVVLAVGDRHIEIATATGYADRFDAAACNALLQLHAVPALREGRLADALAATLEELARRLAVLPTPVRAPVPSHRSPPGWLLVMILLGLLVALAAHFFGHPRGGGGTGGSDDSSWSSDSGSSDSGSSDSGSSDSGSSDGGGGADY